MASLKSLLNYFRGFVGETITGVDDLDWSGGSVPVSAASLPLPTGGATAAKQDTGNSSLASIDGKLPAAGTYSVPEHGTALTKSDSTDITSTASKGLYVGTGGDISVKHAGDSTAVTYKNVAGGAYIWGAFSRLMAATTASDVVGLS